ncbi:MAG: hypothetical protein MN733_00450 [Nitrososphaera sp.]|nr:hypothetical protein [Nitrososphaera sp.]
MAINNLSDLFNRLISTTSSTEVKQILDEIGDYADAGLDDPFGKLGLFWHPYGGNTSNISTIGLATKAARSLTERITNAIDAILEDRATTAISKPTSPQRAASEWFGRPITGPDSGLYKWEYAGGKYDRRVVVVINSSETETAPTVDILDYGIGLTADQFPGTILSLQSGNKMNKRYVLGAFGQGGSSTLGFCEYALIVSRPKSDPSQLAFTLIRVLNLSDEYKEDCYAYLAVKKDNAEITVPRIKADAESLSIYNVPDKIKLGGLVAGTLVRHYSYNLERLTGTLSPQPGNLYHYLHFSMFDALIPFRVFDLREKGKEKDEVVKGSRNRLMDYAGNLTLGEISEDSRTQLKHYRPMEYVVPQGSSEPCIGIEYWVIFNQEKKKSGEYSLRSDSNVLFVQRRLPIIGTLNGQTQGEFGTQLLRDAGLGLLARHIIIHIDGTLANPKIRRELFSTTREGFKEGPVLSSIMQVLDKMLREDKKLEALERELTEKLTSKETETTNEEVRKQITKLLLDAGFVARAEGQSVAEGQGDKQKVPDPKRRPYKEPEPLPTLPFPQVTKVKIATPLPKMEIHINDAETVLVETDADAEFDRRTLVGIRWEPKDQLELASKSPLRGGRIRWRLRTSPSAVAGAKGKIIAAVTRPDSSQVSDSIEFDILPEIEKEAKQNKGLVPPFDIVPIDPDHEKWALVWPDLEDTPEKIQSVAYKPITLPDGTITVYYSTEFTPFKAQVDKLKLHSEALFDLFKTNYEIWIGYHAILQTKSDSHTPSGMEEDAYEAQMELERARVAQMQVKQALRTAELMRRLTREQGAASSE